ncbi:ankyrin repeat and SAM domain-containing protein 4B [Orycteropus afer afer]|uniref:Ankyrin repeat and SAM domain-containing protein 4B n=1 Tax=Orycteropus afer afer TaxID=1230840 RepID=A0A8B7B7E9_ORYAF|nr:ankyrin repeat and SAM domain-containing protein 4B [Orycteropus afer afer]
MSTRYHQAASDSYLELLKEATKRDLNLSDEDGMTPTLLAAYHGNLEALEIICSRGGDPDRCDIWGNTPLHYAASNGHAHCVSFLVNFGANIFALDNDMQSPLDAAASREQNQCVALLDKAATTQNILQLSAEEDNCVQHESILSRPGLGNIVFRGNTVLSPEDFSDSKRALGLKISSELLQRQGAAEADEAEADEEGEENGHGDELPWDKDEVEWEEDMVDATPLEVFLKSHHLEEFLPIFMREQIDLEALLLCSDEDLQSIRMQLGPRKKVLNAINRRKQVLQHPGQMVDTSL